MPVAAPVGAITLPLPPPKQGPGPVHTDLTPVEPLPSGNGLEAVTGQGQAPVTPHPGMNINQTVAKLQQLGFRDTLPLGKTSQGQAFRLPVVKDRPTPIAIQKPLQPKPATGFAMLRQSQDRVIRH